MIRVFLMRLCGAALFAALAATVMAIRPAAAATLRAEALVTADVVTLGDLFDGAGDLAGRPVFRSPDAGVDGALPAAQAIAAAAAAGLAADPPAFDTVTVVRAGTLVGEDALSNLVRQAVADRLRVAPDSLDVTFDGLVEGVTADASADRPVTVSALSLQTGSGRFLARLAVDVGADERTVDLAGRAIETERVVVVRRAVERRGVITAADVDLQRTEKRRASRAAVTDIDAVVGMAAKRALRPGDAIIAADLEPPRLVGRGDLVTIVYERPGLSLSARGRALGDGTLGDIVTVLNEQSRRTVEGVVDGPGRVRVDPATPTTTAALTQ